LFLYVLASHLLVIVHSTRAKCNKVLCRFYRSDGALRKRSEMHMLFHACPAPERSPLRASSCVHSLQMEDDIADAGSRAHGGIRSLLSSRHSFCKLVPACSIRSRVPTLRMWLSGNRKMLESCPAGVGL
jgi:hypothetical protein